MRPLGWPAYYRRIRSSVHRGEVYTHQEQNATGAENLNSGATRLTARSRGKNYKSASYSLRNMREAKNLFLNRNSSHSGCEDSKKQNIIVGDLHQCAFSGALSMQSVPALLRSKATVIASIITFSLALLLVILIPRTASGIWSSSNFLPHAYCFLYDKGLLALHVVSDTAIWLSYVSIAITLSISFTVPAKTFPSSGCFSLSARCLSRVASPT